MESNRTYKRAEAQLCSSEDEEAGSSDGNRKKLKTEHDAEHEAEDETATELSSDKAISEGTSVLQQLSQESTEVLQKEITALKHQVETLLDQQKSTHSLVIALAKVATGTRLGQTLSQDQHALALQASLTSELAAICDDSSGHPNVSSRCARVLTLVPLIEKLSCRNSAAVLDLFGGIEVVRRTDVARPVRLVAQQNTRHSTVSTSEESASEIPKVSREKVVALDKALAILLEVISGELESLTVPTITESLLGGFEQLVKQADRAAQAGIGGCFARTIAQLGMLRGGPINWTADKNVDLENYPLTRLTCERMKMAL